ncbi:MAG: MarC family protein [Candidatus Symbiothrix sp.]|jgi:MarC family membrane protein|nr:MarC family protein [Candidatus Symbiothrix sp.]
MEVHQFILFFATCFAALFPVIDPIGSGIIVNGYFGDVSDKERKQYNQAIFRNCLVIGIVTVLAGHLVMLMFGLAVPAIQIGGGVVICKTGLEWLNNSDAGNEKADKQEGGQVRETNLTRKLFYPISFPICLGPGTISVIFTLMATAEKADYLLTGIDYLILIVAIILQLIILYLVVREGSKINRKLGPVGMMIINKLIAFITFCIGIQIILSGIGKAFGITVF